MRGGGVSDTNPAAFASLQQEPQKLRPRVLAFFVHVLDRGLVDHEVGRTIAVYLETTLVIPLDDAADFFAIAEHDDHRRSRLHLLLIIKILSVGLLGRRRLAASAVTVIAIVTIVAVAGALRTIPPLPHGRGRMVVVVAR